jgi:hypothetical protein
MTLEGTVVNGRIVVNAAFPLPEGARVWIEVIDPAEEEVFPIPPLLNETYEEHIAILRQSIADAAAGIGVMSFEEFDAEMKKEFGTPEDPVELVADPVIIRGSP